MRRSDAGTRGTSHELSTLPFKISARFVPIVLLCCLHWPRLAQAQTAIDDETLAEMFRHDLVASAERYVQANLARDILEPSQRALWTKRLLECKAQAALRGVDAALWQECEDQYQAFAAAQPNNSRLPWISWQYARCLLLQSQANLARHVAAPANQQPRQEALQLVRDIVRLTDELDDDIKRRQPLAARQGVSGGSEAPAEQLDQLRVESGLLRCEALIVRAKLYPKDSRDRIAASTEVEQQASDILKTTSKSWASRGPLLIAQATALLELGQRPRGLQILAKILQDHGRGSRLSQQAAVVAIDELAISGESSRATQLLNFIDASTVEFRLAELQIALAEARRLSGDQRQQELGRLVGLAKGIGQDFGSYWRNRAEALLLAEGSTVGEGGTDTGNLDVMLAEVRQLLAGDNETEAVSKLLEFRDNAVAAGRADSALQLAKLASTLLGNRQGNWAAAADALEEVCRAFPSAADAAETHARAVTARAEQLRKSPDDSQAASDYEETLIRQLTNWPDAAITQESQQWLRKWLQSKDRLPDLLTALSLQARNCQDAEIGFQVLQQWLAVFASFEKPELRADAITELSRLVDASEFEVGAENAKVILAAAKLLKVWPVGEQSRELDSQLNALSRQPAAESASLLAALQLLMDTRQKNLNRAQSKAHTISPEAWSLETQRLIIAAMVEALAEVPIQNRARWLRTVVDSEWLESLASSQQPRQQAAAHRLAVWQGNVTDALAKLTKLVKDNPRDGWLLLELGATLADTGQNRLGDSTKLVRRVAATSRPGSELYLAARWQWVKNLLSAGETEKAAQTAKLVLASPIALPVYEQRFESVAR